VVVDRVVAVIRRHVLADREPLGLEHRWPRRGGCGQDGQREWEAAEG